MSKVSVVSFSYRGVTDKLVQALAQGISEGGGEVSCKPASEASIDDLLASDVFVLASGQPFGVISGPMKTFLESCWISPEREQLQGKPFTYIVNGSSDPKDSGAYLEKLAGYFRWPLAAEGILTTASAIDGALDQARQLGVALAKLQK
ncbi:MAG: flavodoxin family protein [Chloroflexi bacterium]|nr:flavodoxin family protein [Chloroflexota bacterium]